MDPVRAAQLHPHDERRILRSLEVFRTTGKPHGDVTTASTLSATPEQPRFDFRVLWLTCDPDTHEQRLRKRMDAMLAQGLVAEVRDFVAQVPPGRDMTKGIFQAMGWRELEPLVALPPHALTLPENQPLLNEGKERLVTHHRQYVRKQLKWIRRRILPRNVPVFAIDTTRATEEGRFDPLVFEPALAVTQALLAKPDAAPLAMPFPASPHALAVLSNTSRDESVTKHEKRLIPCDVCGASFVSMEVFEQHVKGRRHRDRVKAKEAGPFVRGRRAAAASRSESDQSGAEEESSELPPAKKTVRDDDVRD